MLSNYIILIALFVLQAEAFKRINTGKALFSGKTFTTSPLFNKLKDEPIPENETEQQMRERLRKKV